VHACLIYYVFFNYQVQLLSPAESCLCYFILVGRTDDLIAAIDDFDGPMKIVRLTDIHQHGILVSTGKGGLFEWAKRGHFGVFYPSKV